MPVRQALPGGDLVAETAPRGRSDPEGHRYVAIGVALAALCYSTRSLAPFIQSLRGPGGPHRRSSFAQMPGLVQGRCPWPSSRGPLSQVVPSVALFLWDYAPLFFEPGPQPEAGPHSESESEAGEPESGASSHHDGATAPLRCHMPLTT